MNEEHLQKKEPLNNPQIYSKNDASFAPGNTEKHGAVPPVDMTQPPEVATEAQVKEIDLDTEEVISPTQQATWNPEPAQPTTNGPITEIAIDDDEVEGPSDNFQRVDHKQDPNNIVQPENGLTKNEAHQNDEEQMLKGGGEVTLSTVTTYQDTIKEALQTQSMSGAKLLMAEQRKRDARKEEDEIDSIRTPVNKLYVMITAFFIIMTVGAIGAVIYFNNQPQQEDRQRAIRETFFQPDSVIEVPQSQLGRNTILKIQQVLGSPVSKRGVHQVVVTKEIDGAPDSAVRVTANAPYNRDDYFALTEARVTDRLRNALGEVVFLGIEAGGTNEPFMLYKVNSYNSAFAGMLAWERTLIRDMSKIFSKGLGDIVLELARQNAIIEQQNSSIRQASATAPTVPIQTITSISVFEDQVIGNTDARVIRNEAGNVVFFYTFINNEYLFFGTSARSLNEVQKKIRSAKLVL